MFPEIEKFESFCVSQTLDKLKKLEVGTRYSEEVKAKNGKLRKAKVINI